jgi:tRNA (guanosine-2'-O-)-methyltransferase
MTPERFRKLKQVLTRRQPDLTVLAADVHKPHNISAIFRTCDAVGIHRVHAVSPRGEFHHHRMASGSARHWVGLNLHRSLRAAIDRLRADEWQLVAAHPSEAAQDFRRIDYTQKTALVLGSELEGLDALAIRMADATITIPMQGMVESLNVSVAAALVLYEAQRQRYAAGMYDNSRLDPDEFNTALFEWAYPEIADRLKERGQAYPELSDDGELLSNPLRAS